jgi:hypothetical protein
MRRTGSAPFFRRARMALAAVLLLPAFGLPSWADTLAWRQTSVLAAQQGPVATRRGVAIFSNAEPATMTVQIKPLAPPSGRSVEMGTEMVYRFEDGSSLSLQGRTTLLLAPEGGAVRGESTTSGQVVSGTGRFSGAAGTFTMRVRTDIDRAADGALGDYFAVCEATFTLAK